MLRTVFFILTLGLSLMASSDAFAQRFRIQSGAQGQPANAAPEATVSVSARRLLVDDDLRVELRMSGDFDRVEEPKWTGFEVLGRQTSQQIQLINGKMTREQVLTLELRPERPGQLVIAPLKLFRDDEVVAQSQPVRIQVDAAPTEPSTTASASRDLDSKASEEMFIQVETDRDAYFVGEPFVIRSRLFFRRDLGVNSLEYVSEPRLEGLLAEELLDRSKSPRPKEKRLRGRRFRYVEHSLRLATGLKPGRVTIDAATMRVQTGGIFRSKKQTLRSRAFTLDILPLPADGRPASFREGNIGLLALRASLSNADGATPRRVQTGERLILDVQVSGTGSLVGVKPPQINSDPNFSIERLPDTSEDVIHKDASGMRGTRLFRYIVTPRQPGTHGLPDVTFGYFDPKARDYREHRWSSQPLMVSGRAVIDQQRVSQLNQSDIGPNVDVTALSQGHAGDLNPLQRPLVWLLFALPLLGLIGVEGRQLSARIERANPARRRAAKAGKHARRALSELRQANADDAARDFYATLSKTLLTYLGGRTGYALAGATQAELKAMLTTAGVPDELQQAIRGELERCDFASYAPDAASGESMTDALARVEALIQRVEGLAIEVMS